MKKIAKNPSKKPSVKKPVKASKKSDILTIAGTDKVLVIRTVDKNLQSLGGPEGKGRGFQWPSTGPVACSDWDPKPECGNGLHGLLWGEGDWSLLSYADDAVWLLVEVLKTDIVSLGQKVKFPKGEVVFSGGRADAITKILCHVDRMAGCDNVSSGNCSTAASSGNCSKAASSGDYSKAASSGNGSTAASSGDCSTAASSGYGSKAASSGYGSKAASSGDGSTAASSGNCSTAASSGDNSKAASSGNGSTAASSGDCSTAASSGYGSKAASSGYGSKAASSGDGSTAASSGNCSTAASSGDNTIAMVAGLNGQAKAGPNGFFTLVWFDGKRNRPVSGLVGENDIKADTWYKVNEIGALQEC